MEVRDHTMHTSQSRILTTHVGSLPRSDEVVELLQRREHDAAAALPQFGATMRNAVAAIVQRQVDIGIDAVSDGETSKINYATYVRARLAGFSDEGSTEPARPHLDLAPFPELRRKMALLTGTRRAKRVACVGPIQYCGHAPLAEDLANMKAAVAGAGPVDAFLNAASPVECTPKVRHGKLGTVL
jgi:5-methyltetrahydropteroyltriglutamate--homocysteine methyltransferase